MPYPSSFGPRIRAMIPSPMLARAKKTMIITSGEVELLPSENSTWNMKDKPVPRKKRPANISAQRAGLNPDVTFF